MTMPRERTSPRPETGASETIVAGYDGSAAARRAVMEAAERAGHAGRVVLVHASESPSEWLDSPFYHSMLAAQRRSRQRILDDLDDLDLADVTLEVQFADGPAAEALVSEARARDAREIVVGSRGLGRLRAAISSVSQRLLRHADRPVVIVPAEPPGNT
jgi:nucleotide-binding universal stress UspA family protein